MRHLRYSKSGGNGRDSHKQCWTLMIMGIPRRCGTSAIIGNIQRPSRDGCGSCRVTILAAKQLKSESQHLEPIGRSFTVTNTWHMKYFPETLSTSQGAVSTTTFPPSRRSHFKHSNHRLHSRNQQCHRSNPLFQLRLWRAHPPTPARALQARVFVQAAPRGR